MQNSNAVVKKIYCVVINGEIQEELSFKNIEIAKDYIKLFSLKYRQENTIAIHENIPNNYRYHYKGDLPECGLKIK